MDRAHSPIQPEPKFPHAVPFDGQLTAHTHHNPHTLKLIGTIP